MKAIVVEKPNAISYKEVPKPQLDIGEVLIKVRCVGICATDFAVMEGKVPMVKYPVIPGHEWTGVVEEVADEKDEYLLGKRVVGENHITCMRCPACRQGKWNQCPTFDEVGYSKDGGYAPYLKTIANNLHPIPDNISDQEAALIEPTAVAVFAMLRTSANAGDNVTILGDGPIGILCMQIAKLQGGQNIFVAGGHDERLGLCKKLGASFTFNRHQESESVVERVLKLHTGGSDLVIEAAGSPSSFKSVLDIAGQGAKIGVVGFCEWAEAAIQPDQILTKNLTVVGSNASPGAWGRAIKLVASGEIDLKNTISHTFELDEYERAFEIVRNKRDGLIKAVFVL